MRGALLAVVVLAGACQSVSEVPRPALLMPGDDAGLERVKAALAREMGRARVELGASAP